MVSRLQLQFITQQDEVLHNFGDCIGYQRLVCWIHRKRIERWLRFISKWDSSDNISERQWLLTKICLTSSHLLVWIPANPLQNGQTIRSLHRGRSLGNWNAIGRHLVRLLYGIAVLWSSSQNLHHRWSQQSAIYLCEFDAKWHCRVASSFKTGRKSTPMLENRIQKVLQEHDRNHQTTHSRINQQKCWTSWRKDQNIPWHSQSKSWVLGERSLQKVRKERKLEGG